MRIEWDIDKVKNLNFNIENATNLALTKIWLIVQNRAKENAPYLTWTLRKSIATDFDNISKWFVVVWSPVQYAKRREYENKLHPDRKFYLKRWYTENKKEILNIVRRFISEKLN